MENSEKSLIRKAFWILRHRPLQVWRGFRDYAQFRASHMLIPFVFGGTSTMKLGNNVRVQRLSSLLAERPDARIEIGAHSIVYENARIGAYGRGVIKIGECSVLGAARIYSRSSIKIGRRLVCSWNVFIQDFDSHPKSKDERARQVEAMCRRFSPSFERSQLVPAVSAKFASLPIVIGDDVWLGANCTVLKGTVIGDGCIVAAGAVVVGGNYPACSLIAGNPARVIRELEE